MNLRMVCKYLGFLLLAEALFMLPAAACAHIYAERDVMTAIYTSSAICALVGGAVTFFCRRENANIYSRYSRESFVVAGAGWILVSLFGALPFYLSGHVENFANAFFESVAGFTTTGTFAASDIDLWSRGLLFWRNFTQWLGGIGVLAFVLAVVRAKSGAGFSLQMFRAESPGPQVGKVAPKTRESVQAIFWVYVVLSALLLFLLLLGGMPLFDALCTTFGVAGTGGFGSRNDGMASFAPHLQLLCTVFMLLFGVNFVLYLGLLRRGSWRQVAKDEELRLYGGIVGLGIFSITVSLLASGVFGHIIEALHNASFMTASVMTSTGLSISDYGHWPAFARAVLFVLMIVGAMGGSTAGGFKIGRLLILLKSLKAGLHRMLHPRSVKALRINGKVVSEDVFQRTQLFLFVYSGVILLSFLLVSIDGMPLEQNLTAVIACLNNVGPASGSSAPCRILTTILFSPSWC